MANSKRRARPANQKTFNTVVKKSNSEPKTSDSNKTFYVPFLKAEKEEQIVTGIVLQPDIVDAHGDFMKEDVVKAAAYKFLSNINKTTKLGLQHKNFKKKFELLESYIAPQNLKINGKEIKKGTWIITVKVLDKTIWNKVKNGEITGFSIGGKAKAKKINKKD